MELSGLAANMDPTSISFTSLTGPGGIVKTIEHNFDYSVVSRQTLCRNISEKKSG